MFHQGEINTIVTKTILYKVTDSTNPYFVGKFFRLISRKSHPDVIDICFFRSHEEDEPCYSIFIEQEEVAEFFQINNIKYEIDQDYGRKQIEYLKHKIEMLKTNYELPDPGIIKATTLSAHSIYDHFGISGTTMENTYKFQLECD